MGCLAQPRDERCHRKGRDVVQQRIGGKVRGGKVCCPKVTDPQERTELRDWDNQPIDRKANVRAGRQWQ